MARRMQLFTVRMTSGELDDLKRVARHRDMTPSALIRALVDQMATKLEAPVMPHLRSLKRPA